VRENGPLAAESFDLVFRFHGELISGDSGTLIEPSSIKRFKR
jgi:hypothetical protein